MNQPRLIPVATSARKQFFANPNSHPGCEKMNTFHQYRFRNSQRFEVWSRWTIFGSMWSQRRIAIFRQYCTQAFLGMYLKLDFDTPYFVFSKVSSVSFVFEFIFSLTETEFRKSKNSRDTKIKMCFGNEFKFFMTYFKFLTTNNLINLPS